MSLSSKEFQFLQILQREPMISYTELARRLNTNLKTIRQIIRKLSEPDVEEGDAARIKTATTKKDMQQGMRTPLNFYAIINYSLLGLMHKSFLVSCNSEKQMEKVEQFCDQHPYTSYRARVYGGQDSGLYIIFHIPPNAFSHLSDALSALKKSGVLQNFTTLTQEEQSTITTVPDINAYNPHTNTWDFSVNSFRERLDWMSPVVPDTKPTQKEIDHFVEGIDLLNMMILREWMFGAGPRKQKSEILRNFINDPEGVYHDYSSCKKDCDSLNCRISNLNRHLVAQREKILRKSGIIKGYGIGFDRSKVLIYNRLFFAGTASREFLAKLAQSLYKGLFPFSSVITLSSVEDSVESMSFCWWLEAPPKESTSMVTWLFKNCLNLQTFIISNKFSDSIRYPIYHENYKPSAAETDGPWIISKQYCFDQPLYGIIDIADQSSID
ncbi:MAG: winged helix-turn-helix transcriptional regulator [Candidatus Odinarchaeota archaeon]